jgi:3-keto-L-gulonate-6-phosphate decarboxylase
MGLGTVERIKRHVPDTAVVAEMMSADWGRDQVVPAAEASAGVVLLIGPATVASVAAAVDSGRRLGVPIVLDVPLAHASRRWIQDMEQAGVDGIAVTTNIDLDVGAHPPLMIIEALRQDLIP